MKKFSIILGFIALALSSCIKNDIPYPLVVASIKSMEVPGASVVSINEGNTTVTLTLKDTTDICNVRINNVKYSVDKLTVSPELANCNHDLSAEKIFTLTTYQNYKWIVKAEQKINRVFKVDRQVGSSVIDEQNHRVIAKVPESSLLSYIKVLECKLGPDGITTYDKDMSTVTNFTKPVELKVTCHKRTEVWTIYVEKTDISVTLNAVDAWTKIVWMYATGIDGDERGFCYRKKGDTKWINVPSSSIIYKGGDFQCSVDGLEPCVNYQCLAFDAKDSTTVQDFTTQGIEAVPNGGFEVYSHAEDSKYYSLYDPAHSLWNTKWWDSGNQGSTTVGEAAQICTPDKSDKVEGESSIRLNSRFVVVKFAAGNAFAGEFAGIIGTSGGKVNFGRPFTLRPRKLLLALKYIPGEVDNINGAPAGDPVKMGDPDRCQVYIALGDWDYRKYGGTKDSPVQVNTTDKSTFFNPKGENVIGYGTYITNENTKGWRQIEIPIAYVSTSRVPTHIIISTAASMLGDYFTGSSTSILWLDDFRFEY